jgi:hypothetical protein
MRIIISVCRCHRIGHFNSIEQSEHQLKIQTIGSYTIDKLPILNSMLCHKYEQFEGQKNTKSKKKKTSSNLNKKNPANIEVLKYSYEFIVNKKNREMDREKKIYKIWLSTYLPASSTTVANINSVDLSLTMT